MKNSGKTLGILLGGLIVSSGWAGCNADIQTDVHASGAPGNFAGAGAGQGGHADGPTPPEPGHFGGAGAAQGGSGDEPTPPDSSAGASGGPSVCTHLDWSFTALAVARSVTTPMPEAQGGEIVEGSYVLTVLTRYDAAEASEEAGDWGEVIQFEGNTFESVWIPRDEQESLSSGTFTVDGAEFNFVEECPRSGSEFDYSLPYSATATTFTTFGADRSSTYVKR